MKAPQVKFRAVALQAVPADKSNDPKGHSIKVVTGLGMLPAKCYVSEELFYPILQELNDGGQSEVEIIANVVGVKNTANMGGDTIAFGRLGLELLNAQLVRDKASKPAA